MDIIALQVIQESVTVDQTPQPLQLEEDMVRRRKLGLTIR